MRPTLPTRLAPVAVLVPALVGCGGAPSDESEAARCGQDPVEWTQPAGRLPDGELDEFLANTYPGPEAVDLVPDLGDGLCFASVEPLQLPSLQEAAVFGSSGLAQLGEGVVHDGDEAVASVFVTRVEEPEDLDDVVAEAEQDPDDEVVVASDGTVLRWGTAGGRALVFWSDGTDVVIAGAEDLDALARVARAWLSSRAGEDVAVPVPEPADDTENLGLEPPLLAGPPLDGVPDGVVALPLDPVLAAYSDFTDDATFGDGDGISATGHAVLLDAETRAPLGTLSVQGYEDEPSDQELGERAAALAGGELVPGGDLRGCRGGSAGSSGRTSRPCRTSPTAGAAERGAWLGNFPAWTSRSR